MAASSTSIQLSLRPTSRKHNLHNESLPSLIQRINAERGFKNITEESLQREIAEEEGKALRSSQGQDEDQNPTQQEVDQDTPEEARKKLFQKRQQLINLASVAYNEAGLLVDFTSLLLRKDLPERAETTLSDVWKRDVPRGSLAWDKLPIARPTAEQETRDRQIATGWNLKSLQSSADSLLNAADRLHKDMTKEARYWEQLLKVKEGGWSLCRIPREPHTVGVRYSFSESTPYFYNQGLAALRPDAEGNVILDPGLRRERKALRVAVTRNGDISYNTQPLSQDNDAPLETTIRAARDSLFEEELFHALTLEARSLLGYGVTLSGSAIHVPITSEGSIDLTLEPLDYQNDDLAPPISKEADTIALALRILLTHSHRQHFRSRTKPPLPLSLTPAEDPVPSLLKPILQYLRHASTLTSLETYISNLATTLKNAGLANTELHRHDATLPYPTLTPFPNHTTETEKLITQLCSHWRSTLRLPLPTSTHAITLDLMTVLDREPYGTGVRFMSSTEKPSLFHTNLAIVEKGIMERLVPQICEYMVSLAPGRLSYDSRRGRNAVWIDTPESAHVPSNRNAENGANDRQRGTSQPEDDAAAAEEPPMENSDRSVRGSSTKKLAIVLKERSLELVRLGGPPRDMSRLGHWTAEDGEGSGNLEGCVGDALAA